MPQSHPWATRPQRAFTLIEIAVVVVIIGILVALTLPGFDDLSLRRVKRAYEQIADQFRELILVGQLKPGMRLPTEVDLAVQLGVGRSTIYGLMGSAQITSRKVGRRTLITTASILTFMEALPAAEIAAPKDAAR